MKILGIIPARYASSRFPGKPLMDIGGKSMIRRVYEQACLTPTLNKVIVATDDERIMHHLHSFGGEVVETAKNHPSGTDRCAEVLFKFPDYDIIINIQGDEPFIHPSQIEMVVHGFKNDHTQIVSLYKRITSMEELHSPHTVKVVMNQAKQALYFSRSAIPFLRGEENIESWVHNHLFYKHIGIYGYRAHILKAIVQLPSFSLEEAECLEQLRWLGHGYSIQLIETSLESISIDTPADLERLNLG